MKLLPVRSMAMAVTVASLLISSAQILFGAQKPNIVFVFADDLGYGELGCYGQTKIKTPNIDGLAKQGMRFTQFYSGAPVCAPSRCMLMTGKHSGHAAVRDNREVQPEGQWPIPADAVTIADCLKKNGYRTAAIGKWGMGMFGSSGDPLKQGFDLFYGYNCQRHAHNHYPKYLWRNDQRETLEGNTAGATGKQFSQDLITKEALNFIRENKSQPFFLFLPVVIPHVSIQVPEESLAKYRGKLPETKYEHRDGYQPHSTPHAGYAAMVSHLDDAVGKIMAELKSQGLDENTVVIFSSDNGPTHGRVGGADSDFFESSGPLRGRKGSVYEGGIRVPLIVRWPGKIKADSTCDVPFAAWDLLPTLCQLTGATIPAEIDGISFSPTLLGEGGQKSHDYLYWEFPGYGGQQAVRMGDWKGVRVEMHKGKFETQLYDLRDDVGESRDVAKEHPEIVAKIEKLMASSRVPSADFPFKALD